MDQILKLLEELKIKVKKTWHQTSIFNKAKIDFCDFKLKGKRYVISTVAGKSFVFTIEYKHKERTLYWGCSFKSLEDAIRKEVSEK